MSEIFGYIFANIGSIIGTTVLYGFLGLTIPIATLIILKRNGLLQRRFWINRMLIGFYYVYLPLVMGITFTAMGGLSALKNNAIEQVDAVFVSVSETTLPALQQFVESNTEELAHEAITNEAIVEAFMEEDNSVEESSIKGKLVKWTLMGILSYAEGEAVERASDATGLGEGDIGSVAEGIINLDAEAIHQGAFSMVEGLIIAEISLFFLPYALFVKIVIFFATVLPVLDLSINGYRAYKRQQKAATASPSEERSNE